jgi:NAD(P)-dependent dehydrogenase (short-subunit alcohol dehydrogenase family)
MGKTILITGATDGIGLMTARRLAEGGHTLLLHGRNQAKLNDVTTNIQQTNANAKLHGFIADLSDLQQVKRMADDIKAQHQKLDVLVNNAGVFKTSNPVTDNGYDIRFIVNSVAPYLLTKALISLMDNTGRIVNISSAAQAPVNLKAFEGNQSLTDSSAYAQSKLALIMWGIQISHTLGVNGPAIIAINPASFLGSKMVKQAYGSEGKDLAIGADILVRASLSKAFSNSSGRYFDNDLGQFVDPLHHALIPENNQILVAAMNKLLSKHDIHI